MNVLVACEESQRVCIAFRERGHNAFSCDIQEPSGGHPEWHVHGDCLKILQGGQIVTMDGVTHDITKWDLLIAHPPCTFLSNAGARHLYKGGKLQKDRYKKGMQGKAFFMAFYQANVKRLCIENPIPSRCYGLPPYTQAIQPYEYGHPYTKKTCLWLRGLPMLKPTKIIKPIATWCPSGSYSHRHNPKHRGAAGDGNNRAKNRSKTFDGIAQAMAEQWGNPENYEMQLTLTWDEV